MWRHHNAVTCYDVFAICKVQIHAPILHKTKREMANIFNIIPGPQEDTCCILLYGEIGDYADVRAQDVVAQLMEAERTYRKIDVRINSVGGDVHTGIAIFNALHQSQADITIYIDCIAASTASFIAGCGKPVKMSRYGRIMIHRPMMACVCANADELEKHIKTLEDVENILCSIYSERTGMSVEDIRTKYMDGEEHWLSAEEALALGFVDDIFDDPNKVAVVDTLSAQQLCEQYTAQYLNAIKVSLNKNEQMIEQIKSRHSFSDCADEAAIMNRIAEIEAKAAECATVTEERDALKEKVEKYEQEAKEAEDAAIAAEVQTAIDEGRIGEDQREDYVAMLHTDKAANARAILASQKPKRRAATIIGKGNEQTGSAWEKRMAEIRENLKK